MEIVYEFSRYYEKESANQPDQSSSLWPCWTFLKTTIWSSYRNSVFDTNVVPQYLLCVVDILGLALNGWQADQVRFL